jgi:predicted PurR-regulated permease PerM
MNKYIRNILIILSLILLGYILYQAREIIVYFFIGVVLTFVGRPIMRFVSRLKIRNKHIPSWLAALITMISYVLVIGGLANLFLPVIVEQGLYISKLNFNELSSSVQASFAQLDQWLASYGIENNTALFLEEKITSQFNGDTINILFGGILSGIGDLFIALFAVLFITFFLLKDSNIVNDIIYSLIPNKYIESTRNILSSTKNLLTRYFVGVFIQILTITTLVTLGLKFCGVENALFIGFVAGLVNVIPYVGPLIGASAGILLSISPLLTESLSAVIIPMAAKASIVFIVVQLLDNLVFQPMIFSKSVKAHPLEIFLVIMIAGTVVGIFGMVLAVPVYTFLRIVAKEFFEGYKIVQGLTKTLAE